MTYRSDTDLPISTTDKSAIGYGPAPVRPDAEPVWSIPISGKEFDNRVVFHNDLAIIHREYKEVVAVKAESGEQVWAVEDPMYQAGMKIEGSYWPNSFECADGQVMISDRRFCILDANDGSIIMDRTKRDPENYPKAFAYTQYGDWLRKHTGNLWVHRGTGESQPDVPDVISGFQEHGYRITDLSQHFFSDGYIADWEDSPSESGTRTLICRDTTTWQIRWKRDISVGDLGVDPADKRGRVEPPKLIFQLRHGMVVSSGSYVRGPQGNFAIIDSINGKLVAKGHTGGWLPVELATGRLLHPPVDARDLVLIHQTEGRPFELAHATDGETEDGWLYYLSAIDIATGEVVWTTRESLGCRYKPKFKNPYRDAGSRILCRTGNTLWVKHTAFNDIRYKTAKPGDYWQGEPCKGGEKLPMAKESTVLAAVDHNTGEVLHTRKLPATAEYAGQNDGRLYLREGKKIVCYA